VELAKVTVGPLRVPNLTVAPLRKFDPEKVISFALPATAEVGETLVREGGGGGICGAAARIVAPQTKAKRLIQGEVSTIVFRVRTRFFDMPGCLQTRLQNYQGGDWMRMRRGGTTIISEMQIRSQDGFEAAEG
jgi:hypothetical protein